VVKVVKKIFGFVAEATVLGSLQPRCSYISQMFRRKCTMAETERKNWRELCSAALGAKDPDELLNIVQELNQALKREEQVRRDFREAMRANKASA
jgi:hypothetical protein